MFSTPFLWIIFLLILPAEYNQEICRYNSVTLCVKKRITNRAQFSCDSKQRCEIEALLREIPNSKFLTKNSKGNLDVISNQIWRSNSTPSCSTLSGFLLDAHVNLVQFFEPASHWSKSDKMCWNTCVSRRMYQYKNACLSDSTQNNFSEKVRNRWKNLQ